MSNSVFEDAELDPLEYVANIASITTKTFSLDRQRAMFELMRAQLGLLGYIADAIDQLNENFDKNGS